MERTVLGMLILVPSAIRDVSEDVFRSDQHKRIFRKIADLHERGKPVDLVILASHFEGEIPPSYISDLLTGNTYTESVFGYYLERLTHLARKRTMYLQTVRLQQALKDDDMEAVEDLTFDLHRSTHQPLSQEIESAQQIIESYQDFQKRGLAIKVGVPTLDGITGGFAEGEVVSVLGCPGIAKSALAQNWVRNVVHAYPDVGTLFFSMEMSAPQLGERMLMMELGLHKNEIPGVPQQSLLELYSTYRNCHFITTPGLRTYDIHRLIQRHKAKANIRFVVIDFLHRIRGRGGKPYEEFALITKQLKDSAKELGVVMIVLAQVGRDRGGDGWMPLSPRSARDSGTIEEDSDFVLGLYRPEKNVSLSLYDKIKYQGILVMQVLKTRRTQEIAPIHLRFHNYCLRIEEGVFDERIRKWYRPINWADAAPDPTPTGEVPVLPDDGEAGGGVGVPLQPGAGCD